MGPTHRAHQHYPLRKEHRSRYWYTELAAESFETFWRDRGPATAGPA